MAHEFPGFRAVQRLHTSRRSTVDRAIRIADARAVIVKQPADDVVAAEALSRVQHEHDLLRSVQGPGVVEALEIVRDGHRAALILEDFGADLARWIAERRFSIGEALDVAIEVARSLARIHAAGMVHKDINPSNIVYDPVTRTAKLIDFDLASRATAADPRAGWAAEGTLHYLAPEQTGRLEDRKSTRLNSSHV